MSAVVYLFQFKKRILTLHKSVINACVIAFNNSALDIEHLSKRNLFWEQEKIFEANIKVSKFTEEEKAIIHSHNKAIKSGHFSYNDPFTNEKVLTRLRHFLRGSCCGKACRHCIYEHNSVTNEERRKLYEFNGAFWVQTSNLEEYNDKHYFNGSNLVRVKPSPKYSTQVLFKVSSQKR